MKLEKRALSPKVILLPSKHPPVDPIPLLYFFSSTGVVLEWELKWERWGARAGAHKSEGGNEWERSKSKGKSEGRSEWEHSGSYRSRTKQRVHKITRDHNLKNALDRELSRKRASS